MVAWISCSTVRAETSPAHWQIGTPITTYWASPPITDAAAKLMREGGWNLIWCHENELDTAQKYGLRAMLIDGLISPQSLDNPDKKAQLDALIERVKKHPALYAYFITDEPNASAFPALGKLVAYLRERDPAHLGYINLFPTYANNEQLGTKGDTVTAYREHLRQFIETVNPGLISYDHYHFQTGGADGPEYFLNLGMIRQTALNAGVPFLNIVQASSWSPSMRVPNGNELRWLAYTSLAYGAQGLSYYVYFYPHNHRGMMVHADGTPTDLYYAAKQINPEFVAIAAQLQPLKSLGAYHVGMVPPGAQPLPPDAGFSLEPPCQSVQFTSGKPVTGLVLGLFGKDTQPTHVVVVNLDYKKEITTTLVARQPLDIFNPTNRAWTPADGSRARLNLLPGGGCLLRLRP
ncbi:MAG: hypothetical protein M1608_04410 [Candidatus Omnitrophica bacterium]|nr:hypothetical protein [Candidatus Omnitrophota bacterium]